MASKRGFRAARQVRDNLLDFHSQDIDDFEQNQERIARKKEGRQSTPIRVWVKVEYLEFLGVDAIPIKQFEQDTGETQQTSNDAVSMMASTMHASNMLKDMFMTNSALEGSGV